MSYALRILAVVVGAFPFSLSAAEIAITNAWVRATIGQATVTAAYATINNTGNENDRLIGIHAESTAKTELHRTSTGDGGVMRMRPIQNLDLPAGAEVVLRPGADHLMLVGVERTLRVGDSLTLTFTFEKAGEKVVDAPVARRNPFP